MPSRPLTAQHEPVSTTSHSSIEHICLLLHDLHIPNLTQYRPILTMHALVTACVLESRRRRAMCDGCQRQSSCSSARAQARPKKAPRRLITDIRHNHRHRQANEISENKVHTTYFKYGVPSNMCICTITQHAVDVKTLTSSGSAG